MEPKPQPQQASAPAAVTSNPAAPQQAPVVSPATMINRAAAAAAAPAPVTRVPVAATTPAVAAPVAAPTQPQTVAETTAPSGPILQLPVTVVGRTDVGRLLREVQAIDNFIRQSAIRQPGTALKLPKTSKLMDDLISFNRINALIEEDRNRLIHFLMEVYSRAPILHMSFSADPTPFFIQKLMAWLRREIHPIVLIQIGMQPNMGAGCVVRTTNKYFDFSLRSRFFERRDVLAQRLKGGSA